MKIDIDNTLIRYGRLHLTKQKGFGEDSFHAPPAPLGFYAMPIKFQELFLVGSISSTQPDYMKLPKKINDDDFDYDEAEKIRRKNRKKLIHNFTVKNEDFIWHHLEVKNNFIVDRHNAWVKTTVRDWKIALKKESIKLRAESMKGLFGNDTKIPFQEVRPKTGWYSKDHFEVFIDSKIY